MRRTLFSITLLAAGLAPAVARADAAQDVASGVEYVAQWLPSLRESPASRLYGSHDPADACRKAVAAGKKAGLASDAKIYSSSFHGWDETHYDSDHNAYLELGELSAICDEYATNKALANDAQINRRFDGGLRHGDRGREQPSGQAAGRTGRRIGGLLTPPLHQ